MCEVDMLQMLQPITVGQQLFAPASHRNMSGEPDLSELMGDPMMQALMTADRVDRQALCALLSQVRANLR